VKLSIGFLVEMILTAPEKSQSGSNRHW